MTLVASVDDCRTESHGGGLSSSNSSVEKTVIPDGGGEVGQNLPNFVLEILARVGGTKCLHPVIFLKHLLQ